MIRHLPLSFLCLRSGRLILPGLVVLVAALMLTSIPNRVRAQIAALPQTTFTVTNLNDNGLGSLRQAITDANAAGGGTVDATGVSGIIDLLTQLPNLASNITINGPGAARLTVERSFAQGTPAFGVFLIGSGKTVVISGLTMKNGMSPFNGGAISNSGTLTISDSTLTNNTTTDFFGGGIFNQGILTLNNSTVANNFAFNGGGISNGGGLGVSGILMVSNSTVAGNTVFNSGGGIFNQGMMTLNGSTLSGNASTGNSGGGICNFGGALTVNNTTFANNSANNGGGIANQNGGTMAVSNTTVANNVARNGGGIYKINIEGQVSLQSTIVAKNTGFSIPDVFGATSLGNNLIGDTTSSSGWMASDLLDVDPMFQLDGMGKPLLANNGGPTQTIALLPGSPAIDHGKNPLALTTDQRGAGFFRTYDNPMVSNGMGDGTDIGAFELQPSFDLCLQDDSSGNLLQINTTTGAYQFTNCTGLTIGGTGTLAKRGNQITLQHNASDRRVMASIDSSTKRAIASIQLLSQGQTFSITDRNITNNTCACR